MLVSRPNSSALIEAGAEYVCGIIDVTVKPEHRTPAIQT